MSMDRVRSGAATDGMGESTCKLRTRSGARGARLRARRRTEGAVRAYGLRRISTHVLWDGGRNLIGRTATGEGVSRERGDDLAPSAPRGRGSFGITNLTRRTDEPVAARSALAGTRKLYARINPL